MEQRKRVLLVDDEDDLLTAFEFRLGALGYDLTVARNGAEALEQLNKEKADIVLADFMMPEINGIELTWIIKSHPLWFETQVVLFSCNTEPEFRRKAIVERICKLAPIENEPDRDGSQAGAASLVRGLADMLKLAAEDEALSRSAKLAIGSAQRIADDLLRMFPDSAATTTTQH